MPNKALYSFGHGLGYAQVSYGSTYVSAAEVSGNDTVRVTAKVSNLSNRRHHEVVQLYIHDRAAEITQPVRRLAGIRHLYIEPQSSAEVDFAISRDDPSYVHSDFVVKADKGWFDVWIGPSSTTGEKASFRPA